MIYLKEKGGNKTKFTFPSLPESISINNDTTYQSYSPIGTGEIRVPKGIDTKKVDWSGEFFGSKKKKEAIVQKGKWKSPSECQKILEKWQQAGTSLNLIITETGLNLDVTIASFQVTAYGAFGNIKYTISLEKSSFIKIYTKSDNEVGKKDDPKKVTPRASNKQTKRYTIVAGDNLWKIARKMYGGSGSNWKKIYNANKDVIEKAAKKYGKKSSDNGKWIYPGTKLVIP